MTLKSLVAYATVFGFMWPYIHTIPWFVFQISTTPIPFTTYFSFLFLRSVWYSHQWELNKYWLNFAVQHSLFRLTILITFPVVKVIGMFTMWRVDREICSMGWGYRMLANRSTPFYSWNCTLTDKRVWGNCRSPRT